MLQHAPGHQEVIEHPVVGEERDPGIQAHQVTAPERQDDQKTIQRLAASAIEGDPVGKHIATEETQGRGQQGQA